MFSNIWLDADDAESIVPLVLFVLRSSRTHKRFLTVLLQFFHLLPELLDFVLCSLQLRLYEHKQHCEHSFSKGPSPCVLFAVKQTATL